MKQGTPAYRQYFAAVEETLAAGNCVNLAFGGTSMLPTLKASDKLTFEPLGGRHPEVGDVVLFRHEGMYKVHRIKAVRGGRYTIQGDNCYGVEHATVDDIVARLVSVERLGPVDGPQWARVSRRALLRNRVKNFAIRWLSSYGRVKLRPWYFLMLGILMWAPLNGLGLAMDNYVFGIRMDHLLHASVFIPCSLFLLDTLRRTWLVWLLSIAVAILMESGQYFLPYRGFDVNDLVANVLGVTLGWVAILAAYRLRDRRQHRYPDLARP